MEKDQLITVMRSVMNGNSKEDLRFSTDSLSFISKHRLQPYLKKMTIHTSLELDNQLEEISDRYNTYIDFLETLQLSLKEPIILVKGFTNYHLTQGRILLRETADLDILSIDPYNLREMLLAEGFTELKPETGHELSELQKGNILIDLHKFVPVVSYPPDIKGIAADNYWTTTEGMIFSGKVGYNHLIYDSIEIFEKVRVPSVNMSILILCASMFRDFITSLEEAPHIKLINLVEIYLLLQESSFNREEFLELSDIYHAEHSIEFVNILLEEVYNTYIVHTGVTVSHFPQIASWNLKKWFIPRDILCTVYDTNFESVLNGLDAHQLQLPTDNEIIRIFTNDTHPLYISKNNTNMQVALKFSWTNNLKIVVTIHDVEAVQNKDIFCFNFGTFHTKILFFGSEDRGISLLGRSQSELGQLVYDEKSKTLSINIEILESQLDPYLLSKDKLGLTLYVEKHESDNETNLCLPLILTKDGVAS